MTDRSRLLTGAQWYAIHCKYLTERRTAAALRELLGLETYLPELKRYERGRASYMPFFPGYLFVAADLREISPSRINAAPGVIRLLTFGERPQALAEEIIVHIHQRLTELNAQGGLPSHNYQPGDVVRFKKGALNGLEAVFTGPMRPSERVHVLLDFLGRLNDVEVDVRQLERAESITPLQRERRTRGKGRVITRTR